MRHDLSQADVISLLQKASVFAQASFEEGLGLAGLEAMACGLPMVATDTAGTREYLRSGVNGVLVAQNDRLTVAMADALAFLLREGGESLASEARPTVVRGYSSDRSLARFVRIYEELVAGR